MGSRMKRLLILLFIGVTGIVFLFQKIGKEGQASTNFLEEKSFSEQISEEEDIMEEKNDVIKQAEDEKREKVEEKKTIFVHVCGGVKKEGVYELEEGSRVVDAIRKAGGLQKKASKKSVNQAALLEDGTQVYVPLSEEEEESSPKKEGSASKVNINKASKEELMTLTGIGESRAEAIISFRKENGKFKTISDIMKVNGIKQSSFDKIKDRITV